MVHEQFLTSNIPTGFYWFNEPRTHRFGNGLELCTDEQTDFWQRTFYGFQRDDGHCLLTRLRGDFSVQTHIEFQPRAQYDQCGLMIRAGAETWIKTSIEYEDTCLSRLGSVVTNLGFSDWATQDIPSSHQEACYRISRNRDDFLLEYAFDGANWQQMRIAHLHGIGEELEAGLYACSPTGKGFQCRFTELRIDDNSWIAGTS
jgi:hypothetical protein